MRIPTQAVLAVLLSVLVCSGAHKQKEYQTGKFVDLNSKGYNKIISNPDNGDVISVRRRENYLSVQLGDLLVIGECVTKENLIGRIHNPCQPENWIVGDPIQVRIKGNLMYLKKPDGKEVKTRIVKRVRVATKAKDDK
jgi:hypothetical protein